MTYHSYLQHAIVSLWVFLWAPILSAGLLDTLPDEIKIEIFFNLAADNDLKGAVASIRALSFTSKRNYYLCNKTQTLGLLVKKLSHIFEINVQHIACLLGTIGSRTWILEFRKSARSDANELFGAAIISSDLKKALGILNLGADINRPMRAAEGNPPLVYCALRGDTATIDFLLKNGANINVQNSHGKTALFCAICTRRDTVLARFLISHGAKQEIATTSGTTILDDCMSSYP